MKIQIPTECPCCGYTLTLVNDQLYCTNLSCSAQLNKKLEHFAKTLGIKGMGPKTLDKLNPQCITELFSLSKEDLLKSLGSEKIADKLLDEINRAKNADFATVLASFSIPLIGNTASTKLSKVVSNISDITVEKCKEAGLGEKATNNLINWINNEYQELKEFLPFSFNNDPKPSQSNTKNKTVCITGKLSSFTTKAEATKALELLGFTVVDSITKTTTYLVDEQNNGSAKRKKAESYGITIINNLNNFLEENK